MVNKKRDNDKGGWSEAYDFWGQRANLGETELWSTARRHVHVSSSSAGYSPRTPRKHWPSFLLLSPETAKTNNQSTFATAVQRSDCGAGSPTSCLVLQRHMVRHLWWHGVELLDEFYYWTYPEPRGAYMARRVSSFQYGKEQVQGGTFAKIFVVHCAWLPLSLQCAMPMVLHSIVSSARQ